MTTKLERITLGTELADLSRMPKEDAVKYLKRITVYMNKVLVGFDCKYEETLR